MGWNSFDCYGCSVTEDQVKANADYMAEHLARYGYEYIVIDSGWYTDVDEYGRFIPDVKKFPSAAGGAGFKPLADYVHGKGLKFGIHIKRGVPRIAADKNCPVLGTQVGANDIAMRTEDCYWSHCMWRIDMTKPGAQEYYDSIMAM